MEHLYEKALESAEYIKAHTTKRPKVAVVLGSGLGNLTADFTDTEELPYKDIPNFPVSTVAGHKGALLAGRLGEKEVYALEGRFHFYEGYSMKEVCYPFYVLKLLGVEQVVLTNVQFPKLSKKQDYGTTNGVSRADQLKADIAALQDRLSGKVTLWFSYTLDQCNNSSVALDVPALTLGVQNLLVTSDAAMDADALQALETAATDAGVENLTVHAADRFETDRVSG